MANDQISSDNYTARVVPTGRRIHYLVFREWYNEVDSTQVVPEEVAIKSLVSGRVERNEDEDNGGSNPLTGSTAN